MDEKSIFVCPDETDTEGSAFCLWVEQQPGKNGPRGSPTTP